MKRLLPFFLVCTACAPQTVYRYSALTPAAKPIAWDGRTPRAGIVAEGTLGTSLVEENYFPKLHDTALWVAKSSFEGTLGVVPVEGIQIGVHGSYGDYRWADQSATGTMPLPSHPNLFGFGPDVRVSIPLDREGHAGLGLAGEMLVFSIPYARWQQLGARGTIAPGPTQIYDGYVLADYGSETHFVFTGGIYPSYGFGPENRWGKIFGIIGFTTGFSNDGFTNTLQSGSTIDTYALPLFGGGYGVDLGTFRASAITFFPVSRNDGTGVAYGPGMMITLGVRIGAWAEPKPLGFW